MNLETRLLESSPAHFALQILSHPGTRDSIESDSFRYRSPATRVSGGPQWQFPVPVEIAGFPVG